jgi:DNA-binding NarL/FixJ family response regulator
VETVTPREADVLALLGGGLSNAQIASRLRLSVRTVENHVSSLLRKHGVADRRALAVLAGTRTAGSRRAKASPGSRCPVPGSSGARTNVTRS